jgi:hypothetical protein
MRLRAQQMGLKAYGYLKTTRVTRVTEAARLDAVLTSRRSWA